MTGNDLRDLRKSLCLGKIAFGRALGYNGNGPTIRRMMYRAEGLRDEPISLPMQERVQAMMAESKGPAGNRGQVGWMGGEYDR